MNPTDSQIVFDETSRLESLGIPFEHVHCSDGKAVVTVSPDILSSIMRKRDQGDSIPGLFISYNGHEWLASMIDESGQAHHRSGLTECKAYRWVLGYPIGHCSRDSYFVGGPIFRKRRKKRAVSTHS